MFRYYSTLAFERRTFRRALHVALLVGIILNLINNPEIIFGFSMNDITISRVLLTFMVPFMVSTYSSVISNTNLKPGNVSNLDALLECKRCRKADFHVEIGQEIEECPGCKEKTRWMPKHTFSHVHSHSELLKSLALFARYNPQPLFRVDGDCKITGANPASESLFNTKDLTGKKLSDFIDEFDGTDFSHMIHHKDTKEFVIPYNEKYFNLILRGVPVLESVQVYGSNITEIVSAEKKIKLQAKEISESIRYAWQIQQAMLPGEDLIASLFPQYFMFYRPRDTVSGDFYWLNQVNKTKILVVADCTGHGVPGAFMSMMGISLLNEIVIREKNISPAAILNILRERLIHSLQASGRGTIVADGIDVSVVAIEEDEQKLKFAGAFNPSYIFRKNEIVIMEADRMPVGEHLDNIRPFTEKVFDFIPGDRLILFTDGYKDQFGGERDKKMNSKKFKEFFLHNFQTPMHTLSGDIIRFFDEWKQNNEQVDDVLVMGVEL